LGSSGGTAVAQLWNATPSQLRRVWGGINGLLFHQKLHGVDIQTPSSRYSKSIGHQHVLEPDLRTNNGAHRFAQHLLTKAAERFVVERRQARRRLSRSRGKGQVRKLPGKTQVA
jgi:DNA polymerase-4